MATGKLPFYAAFEADLFRKIQNAKYQFPDEMRDAKDFHLSQGLKNLIRKMFEPNASLRPTAEQVIQDSWFKH